jgi:solute carrier family 25 (mitochondrial carnitine/acylcarnitine transporter), member 20/29
MSSGNVPQGDNAAPAAPPGISQSKWKGFVGGGASGIAKLAVGHPFDTIKVRLQTSAKETFHGPLDCLSKTVKNEGILALYKGATPPLVGWLFMDSLYALQHQRLQLNANDC